MKERERKRTVELMGELTGERLPSSTPTVETAPERRGSGSMGNEG